ncbi:hypothetical protein HK101_005437 [Irineochytrium annulatum]|nr:hypothetical protein HK101_005437 [Irineochytrium annulatum]
MGFNTLALREHARKELVDLLDSEHGVEKIYHLSEDRPDTDSKSLIYICRPKIGCAKLIASHMKQHQSKSGAKIEYSVFFVPRRTLVCERVLEEEGVYGDVTVGEFHLDIIPLEEDFLSLELGNAFRELFLDGDTSAVYNVAMAIMKLQAIFGIVPRIIGKGKCAKVPTMTSNRLLTSALKLLCDLVIRMRRELSIGEGANAQFPTSSQIDSIVILDRTVDLITPMCTQLTYEGLVDEVFGISSTFIELDAVLAANTMINPNPNSAPITGSGARPKKVPLNGSDKLYAQLRDLNFAVVGGVLNQVARRIQGDIEERHQAKTVTQIKDFIGKLSGLESERASLKLHTTLAEQITKFTLDQDFNKMLEVQQNFVAGTVLDAHIDYLDELTNKQSPLLQTLRLLSLYSLVNGGLKQKQYDSIRREITQTYGFDHLVTFQNLARVGLLTPASAARNAYPSTRRLLRLIVDDVDEHRPNDVSYVYSGYAPVSVRLVQATAGTPGGARRTTSTTTTAGGGAGTPAGSPTISNKGLVGKPGNGGAASTFVGWKGSEEVLAMLPGGPSFEETQKVPEATLLSARRYSVV